MAPAYGGITMDYLTFEGDPDGVVVPLGDAEQPLGFAPTESTVPVVTGEFTMHLERALYDDGAWVREGDDGEDASILATAMIAGHLGKTRCVRPACLEDAGRYLAPRWSPDRVQGFVWESVAAMMLSSCK